MISVIVPVYNVEKYLEKCLDSILKQSYQDFELIVIDDGSRDNSGKIADSFAMKDGRVKVVHQENAGISATRNLGVEMAKGEYLTFIDSDDYIEDNFLEILYSNLIENEAQISVVKYHSVYEDESDKRNNYSNKNYKTIVLDGKDACKKIVKESRAFMITAWGKLYHSSLKEFLVFPNGRVHEDEFVSYKCFYKSKKTVISEMPLYNYVHRKRSIMTDGFSIKRLDKLVGLKEAIQFFQLEEDAEMEKAAIWRYVLNIQIYWYRVSRFLKDRKDILTELETEHKKMRNDYQLKVRNLDGFVNKTAFFVFVVSPFLYARMARVMEKLLKEE